MFISVGGEDYTPVNEVIVFSGSSSSEQVAIATHSDGLLEQAESFSIGVFHSEGENVLILPSQSSIWIIDNNSMYDIVLIGWVGASP